MGAQRQLGNFLPRVLLDWLRPRLTETQIMVFMAFLVGIGSGFGAVAFRKLIDLFTWVFFSELAPPLQSALGGSRVYLLLLPPLGALIFGPLIRYFAPEARGHGVPEVMLAVAVQGGRMRPAVVVVKAVASALTLGSGGSVGREGPIVQIGAALGSSLGQLLKMPESRIKNLVAAGAAGGISATFNAPFAGVFFALEVIMGEFNVRNFATLGISAVTADVIGRAFFGIHASVAAPLYQPQSPIELPLYIVLGVLAGLLGILFMRILYRAEDLFDALRVPLPFLTKPVIGALILGALAIFIPRGHNSVPSAILSVGYPTMTSVLYGRLGLGLMLLLLVAKVIAVSLTIGSGGSGGVFSPSLYLGAMLGGVFGTGLHTLFPHAIPANTLGFALVGMASVFSAAAQAPITSITILFEMTNDYQVVLPLMLGVATATLVGRSLSSETIYTLKLFRRGIQLGPTGGVLSGVRVRDVMGPVEAAIPPSLPVKNLIVLMMRHHLLGFPVVDQAGELLGMVSVTEIEEEMLAGEQDRTVADLVERVATVFPDETLEEALQRLTPSDQRRIPVVSRENPCHLVGMLYAWDVLNAYHTAVHAGRAQQMPRDRRPLAADTDLQTTQLTVGPAAPAAGRAIRDLSLPTDALIVIVRRGGASLVPHGGTVLEAGDDVTVLAPEAKITVIEGMLHG